MKHQRLVGADVYVVRLAKSFPPGNDPKSSKPGKRREARLVENNSHNEAYDAHSEPHMPTGSLHDELVCNSLKSPVSKSATETPKYQPTVAESRPCYRCIAYMHSVGIKRVFWTTNTGTWEGAKVRDLIDDLEGAMRRADTSLGLPVPDVFVTKHEVLRLRQVLTAGAHC